MIIDATIILYTVTTLVYGSISIITILFTFSIEQYQKLNEILNLNIISTKILTPLELERVDIIDDWLIRHNKLVGPILTCLSLIDIGLLYNVIDTL